MARSGVEEVLASHNYELSVHETLENISDDEIIDEATSTRKSTTFRTLSSVQKIEFTAQ